MADNQITLNQYTQEAYLDYAMYVILDRALPSVTDGLKPVQRRIIYAMSELGLKAGAKYKKSARTIGDVIGKFHPHGDSACYEAMVLMAQDFSYRYPIVDGHGNWGSSDDPKSFAAMRYTESKLTKYADLLLSEIGKGTVDWQPNFDGSLSEPAMLPARVPNVLLNGSSGIAVGMATDIPPHNMREVLEAVIHLINNPEASVKALCDFVQAPDFPMGAQIITPRSEIIKMYETGAGQIRQRGKYHTEGQCIVFDQLPFQASSSRLVKQVADCMIAKKLPGVVDVRDESDHENAVRLVIELKSAAKYKEHTLNSLFAFTDIEKSMRVNFNMIGLNRKPETKNLKTILSEWVEFRKQTLRRRLTAELEKVQARLEILAGLLLVFVHIDEIIKIIRHHEAPKQALIDKFKLSEMQAEAILEMKLRQLAGLEYIALEQEQKNLLSKEKDLLLLLENQSEFDKFMVGEIKNILETRADERRSELCEAISVAPAELLKKPVIPTYSVRVILSEKGWIRTMRSQENMPDKSNFRAGDQLFSAFEAKSTDTCFVISADGRVFNIPVHQMPGSRGYGEPLSKFIELKADVLYMGVLKKDQLWLLSANSGYGFLTQAESLSVTQKAGKQVYTLKSGERLLSPHVVAQLDQLVLVSSQGRILTFASNEVNTLPKGRGVKLIGIKKDDFDTEKDELSHVLALSEGTAGVLYSASRILNLDASRLDPTRGSRASRGKFLPQGYRQVSRLAIKDVDEKNT